VARRRGAALGARACFPVHPAVFLRVPLTPCPLKHLLVTPKIVIRLKPPWPYLGDVWSAPDLLCYRPPSCVEGVARLGFFTPRSLTSVGRLEEWPFPPLSSAAGRKPPSSRAGASMPPDDPRRLVAAVTSRAEVGLFRRRYLLPVSALPTLLGFFPASASIRSTHAFLAAAAWIALTILTADYLAGGAGAWSRSTDAWREPHGHLHRGRRHRPGPLGRAFSGSYRRSGALPGMGLARNTGGGGLRSEPFPAGQFLLPRVGAPLALSRPSGLSTHLLAAQGRPFEKSLVRRGLNILHLGGDEVLRAMPRSRSPRETGPDDLKVPAGTVTSVASTKTESPPGGRSFRPAPGMERGALRFSMSDKIRAR